MAVEFLSPSQQLPGALPPCLPLAAAPATPLTAALLAMLQRLFKNDRIPHGWMAVSRYEEIEKVGADAICCCCCRAGDCCCSSLLHLRCCVAHASVVDYIQCLVAICCCCCCFVPSEACLCSLGLSISCCCDMLLPQDFKATYQEGEQALRTAILINCGAAEDVRALLNLDERMNVRIIIIDSHRWGAGQQGRQELRRACGLVWTNWAQLPLFSSSFQQRTRRLGQYSLGFEQLKPQTAACLRAPAS